MRRAVALSGFVLAGAGVVVIFVTARSYSQLAIASLLYIPAAYLGFLVLQSLTGKPKITATLPAVNTGSTGTVENKISPAAEAAREARLTAEVVDIDKRAFLKLIGATGLSVFLFSLIGRRIEGSFLGAALGTDVGGSGNTVSVANAPAVAVGYKITEIDDGSPSYYGFTDEGGAWIIMKESEQGNSFRYAAGKTDFESDWKSRHNLMYDYFYKVFPN